jgi:hypothetical protein
MPTPRSEKSPSPIPGLYPLLLALATVVPLAACSADFRSGETKCSTTGLCPSGFACVSGVCVNGATPTPTEATGGTGGRTPLTETGGTSGRGTGGSAGTGGTSANDAGTSGTGGTAGSDGGGTMADASLGDAASSAGSDASAAGMCPDQTKPLYCPPLNGAPGRCFSAGFDCSTVAVCGTEISVCRPGFLNDCKYPTCVPKSCPDPDTQLCPAAGGSGPACRPKTDDCSTLVYCPTQEKIGSCKAGEFFSCEMNACMPAPNQCTDPRFPQRCPDKNGVRGVCATTAADCETLTQCGNTRVVCAKGEKVDCRFPNPCGPVADMCTTPERPKFCPAKDGAGPTCGSTQADCGTLGVCNGRTILCITGRKLDCKYPNPCSPIDNKCTDPMRPQFCPAANGAGPGCWPMGTDCTTLMVCASEVFACSGTGLRYDCMMDKCVPK